MATTESGAFQLGIPGMPPLLASMVSGGLYAVQVSSPPARSALVTLSLSAALRAEQPAVLVTNGSTRRVMGRGRLQEAIRDESLAVFTLRESTAKNIFRHGPERFIQELDLFGFPPEALYVFDGADDLFTLQDPFIAAEQIRCYREWVRERDGCGLLIFTLLGSNSQFSSTYQSLLDHVDGAVRLESGKEQLEWIVDFWASPTGVVASRALRARIESNGVLSISEATAERTTSMVNVVTQIRRITAPSREGGPCHVRRFEVGSFRGPCQLARITPTTAFRRRSPGRPTGGPLANHEDITSRVPLRKCQADMSPGPLPRIECALWIGDS